MGDLETPNLCHFLRKILTLGLLQTRLIRYSYVFSMLSILLAQIIETTCWLKLGIRFARLVRVLPRFRKLSLMLRVLQHSSPQ